MHTVELKYPVEATGETFTNLTMRRSKIKDRLLVAKMKTASDEEKEIRLFANLCEVEPKVIEELDEADYSNLQKVYLGFFSSEGMSQEQSSSSRK
jgi:hypothetical protein